MGFDAELSLEGGTAIFKETVADIAGKWFLLSAAPVSARVGPAALLAASAAGQRGPRVTSRQLLQSTAAGAVFVAAIAPECPQDPADCVFLCISAGFDTEVFGPALLFISKYEGDDCDCKQVFPASAGSSTEDAYMIGRVSRAPAGNDDFAFACSKFPRVSKFFTCLVPLSCDTAACDSAAGGCFPERNFCVLGGHPVFRRRTRANAIRRLYTSERQNKHTR